MPWTHFPLAEGDDWTRVEVLNELFFAYREKRIILGLAYDNFQWAAGDDVQYGMRRTSGGQWTWSQIQTAVRNTVSLYGFYTPGWDGNNFPFFSVWNNDNIWPHINDSPPGSPGYTRKYPREIVNPSAAGSAGQRARSRSDGRMYQYSGGWMMAEDQAAPPDTVTAYGNVQAGDYLGPWILNELYAMINLCHTRLTTASSSTVTQWRGQSNEHYLPGLDEAGWQAAHAEAAADFHEEFSGLLQSPMSMHQSRAEYGVEYDFWHNGRVNLFRRRGTSTFNIGAATGVDRKISFFGTLGTSYTNFGGMSYDPAAFHKFGDDLPDPQLHPPSLWVPYLEAWTPPDNNPSVTMTFGTRPVSEPPVPPVFEWTHQSWYWAGAVAVCTFTFEYADGLPGGGVV